MGGTIGFDYVAGSSPRMWGTLQEDVVHNRRKRIIPTHVGNTSLVAGYSLIVTDHPHACGEHIHIIEIDVL